MFILKFGFLKRVSSLGSELRSFYEIQYINRLCIIKYKETSQHYYQARFEPWLCLTEWRKSLSHETKIILKETQLQKLISRECALLDI